MSVAVLSLGSNMGDSEGFLAEAVAGLRPHLTALSSVYRTPPWGPVAQDDFRNIVAIVTDPDTDAAGWWQLAQRLEAAAHRERPVRWGPRTLDVDIIAVWDGPDGALAPVRSDDPHLILPHPRASERGFVLIPWAELQPDAVLPGHGPITELIAAVDTTGIERIGPLVER